MSKKISKNLSKVQDMLSGNFKTKTQVGYTPTEVNREIGDKWTDSDGVQWEQKNGYRSKINKMPSIGLGDTCSDCKKLILKGWDKDSYKWNKRCYYCQIDYEAQFTRKTGGTELDKFKDDGGAKKWSKLSKKEQKKLLDKSLDGHDRYVIERTKNYIEGWQKDNEIFMKEQDEEKIWDKSVANALANGNVEMTINKNKTMTK
jgi:hypothetical protein